MSDLALRLLVMAVERFLRYLLGPPTKKIRAWRISVWKIPPGTITAPTIASSSINSIATSKIINGPVSGRIEMQDDWTMTSAAGGG